MRKVLSITLAVTLLGASIPAGLLAADEQREQAAATLTGTARSTNGHVLSNAGVQMRNFGVGEVVARTTSGPAGEFIFQGLAPGRYIVEIVEGGKVVGTTAVVNLEAGMTLAVEVLAVSSGALAEADRAGFSLFGLGPAASAAVLGAAGAAAVTAVVSTRPDASPSR